MTPFREIMRRAVESTPGAVGGAFADSQGEMVDSFATSYPANDWAILTAHYGVILAHVRAVFGIWHFGGPEYFIAQHKSLGIVVHCIEGGYFALIAVTTDRTGFALSSLREAATELKKEMT